MNKIQEGHFPLLSDQLGINDPSSWLYIGAGKRFPKLSKSISERVVIHYDMYNNYSLSNGFKHLDELIASSGNVIVLTLCVSPKILLRHNTQRIIEQLLPNSHKPSHKRTLQYRLRKIRLLLMTRNVYKDISVVLNSYEKWINCINMFNSHSVKKHFLLDYPGSNNIIASDISLTNQPMHAGDFNFCSKFQDNFNDSSEQV
jgi:hypothetical protein